MPGRWLRYAWEVVKIDTVLVPCRNKNQPKGRVHLAVPRCSEDTSRIFVK